LPKFVNNPVDSTYYKIVFQYSAITFKGNKCGAKEGLRFLDIHLPHDGQSVHKYCGGGAANRIVRPTECPQFKMFFSCGAKYVAGRLQVFANEAGVLKSWAPLEALDLRWNTIMAWCRCN
jgi:hypothetical protein